MRLYVVHVLAPLSHDIQGMGDVLWNYFILESDGPTHQCRDSLSNTSGTTVVVYLSVYR